MCLFCKSLFYINVVFLSYFNVSSGAVTCPFLVAEWGSLVGICHPVCPFSCLWILGLFPALGYSD